MSAEKLRAVALAAGLVAVEERQIACREGDDGVVGVGDGDSDTRAGAVEAESQLEDQAAARSPDRALTRGASISVFCRRVSAAGCGALRAAENRTSTRTDARKMKGEETRQTTDQRNSPAFGAPAVPCRSLSCLAHHPIPPPAALLRLVISNEKYEGLDNVSHWTPERELDVGENNSGIKKKRRTRLD